MGCGGSRDKETGLHAHLDHWMATIGIEDVDKTFADAKKVIESAEECRVTIVDNRDALVISSGACSYVEPTIADCFTGICWKLSADHEGKFSEAGFTLEQGEVKLDGKKVSAEGKKSVEDFEVYFKGMISLPNKMEEVVRHGKEMASKFAEKATEMTNQVAEAFKDKPLQLPGKIKDVKSNIDKVVNAANIITKLGEELQAFLDFFNKALPEVFAGVAKFDEIGGKAHKAKHIKAYEITWTNITDPKRKYGKKADDGHFFWMRRRDQKMATKQANANKK